MERTVLISNDVVVMGLLALILALVFSTSRSQWTPLKAFNTYVPAIFLCYFLPSLLNTFNIIDGSASNLYLVARNYFLPASLVLLTMSVDLKRLFALGPKALIMFLTGTLGVMIGGPLILFIYSLISPEAVTGGDPDSLWRGLATIAGSWIGGAANQAALRETYNTPGDLFSVMVTIDIVIGNLWMAFLFFLIGNAERIDRWLKADTRAIDEVRATVEKFQAEHKREMTLNDLMIMVGLAIGVTGLSHWLGGSIAKYIGEHAPYLKTWSLDSTFLWVVILATAGGLGLSFTRARNLEGVGASKLGSGFLYILIATVGMQMNIAAVADHWQLFFVGLFWILTHGALLFIVAKLIRAPLFFLCVGSQANIGAAASAPVVAAAFHPSLAPVGVLLSVFGYVLGTYGGYLCAEMMRIVSGG